MFIAAILVGLLVGYYFGVDRGVIAAPVVAGLFFLAAAVPQTKTIIYCLVGGGVALACLFGPHVQTEETRAGFSRWKRQAERLYKLALKLK